MGRQAARKAAPSQGSTNARRAGEIGASPPPLGTGAPFLFPFSPGSARGCKGRSPLHEITLVSPFPLGRALCERGQGDGAESKRKAGQAGGKEGKPPAGTCLAGVISAAWVQARGCKGRSPLHEIPLVSPFPLGRALCERGQGDGAESKRKAGLAGEKESTPPQGTCTADSVSAASGLMQGCRGRSPRRN